MTFAYPHLLYLLILPALLPVLAYIIKKSRSKKWEQLVAPGLRSELLIPPNHARRITALMTGLVGLALMIVALARPQWGEREIPEVYKGRNIMIALDVSRSMLTRDVQPSRLECARTAAFDLMEALPEDKIGLIVFSGEAVVTIPLTHDHAAIRETLEQANYGWVGYGGTDFNGVLELALNTFDRTDGAQALVILSDGENTMPLNPELINRATAKKLIVVAAGIGTATGDSIPDTNSPDGLYHDQEGRLVISKFDPESLKKLAQDTQGEYTSVSSGGNLNQLVKSVSQRLDELESGKGVRKIAEERYAPFLAAGLFLLALSLMLSASWTKNTAPGKTSMLALLFLLSLGSLSAQEAPATPVGQAPPTPDEPVTLDSLLLETDNKLASKMGEDNITPGILAKLAFRNGYSQFQKKEWGKAVESFSKALLSPDARLQTEAHYNLANALAEKDIEELKQPEKLKEIMADEKKIQAMKDSLQEALTHYNDALKLDSGHQNAKANKELVEKIIQRLKKEEEEQQQQNQQNQQNQDQNKNDQKQNQDQKQDQKQDENKQDQQQKQDQNNQQQDKNNDQQKQQDQNKNQDNKNDQKQGQDKKDSSQDKKNDDQQKQDKGDKGDQQEQPDKGPDQKQDQNDKGGEQQQDQAQGENQNGNNDKTASSSPGKEKPDKASAGGKGDQEEKKPTREEAAKILKERSDLEKGTPFPYRGGISTPVKDW